MQRLLAPTAACALGAVGGCHAGTRAAVVAVRPAPGGFAGRAADARHLAACAPRWRAPGARPLSSGCGTPRGPLVPPWHVAARAKALLLLAQRTLSAAAITPAEEESEDDHLLVLVAELDPTAMAPVPRGALAAYCRQLRSAAEDWRNGSLLVPGVTGKQLLTLAAWLNRAPSALQWVRDCVPACLPASCVSPGLARAALAAVCRLLRRALTRRGSTPCRTRAWPPMCSASRCCCATWTSG
jgi:hypothetical protein